MDKPANAISITTINHENIIEESGELVTAERITKSIYILSSISNLILEKAKNKIRSEVIFFIILILKILNY